MTTCSETRKILNQFGGGRPQPGAGAGVGHHLSVCETCSQAVADYKVVVGQARRAFATTESLSDVVRARLARNAAAEALKAPWWSRLLPESHTAVWAAVAPALLVAVVVALPLAVRHQPAPVAAGEQPVRIDMQARNGSVSLAWSDGNGKSYKVYKASDPRRLGQGSAEVVRGNQWVDRDPESSQIVFYRVE